MKFSVLIPTRNRLDYLRYAVESVRRQSYDDWELIISDNDSSEDVKGYVDSLGEPRIRYFRTPAFLPVTENWNNALEKSTGDYVIMLGDDDCLLRDYFAAAHRTLNQWSNPDFIFHNALIYAYPGVLPEHAEGRISREGSPMFAREGVYLYSREDARRYVQTSMNFSFIAPYNMQFSLIKRELISRMSAIHEFFQSPYPDFFSTNAMFLMATRVLIVPDPWVIIGITPKSYGFYHFNFREGEASAFLKNAPDPVTAERVRSVLLPGSVYLNNWLYAMETLCAFYGKQYDLTVNYERYRRLQIAFSYKKFYLQGLIGRSDLAEIQKRMNWIEHAWGLALTGLFVSQRVMPASLAALLEQLQARGAGISQSPHVTQDVQGVTDIGALAAKVSAHAAIP
jgi:glycosyltransferase involved in cell wall biosynthesis